MRTQHHFLAIAGHFVGEVKCVVHRAGRMRFGDIECGEIVPVILNFRPLGHGKAHIGENLRQLVHDLADGVNGPTRGVWRRQRHVDTLGGEAAV